MNSEKNYDPNARPQEPVRHPFVGSYEEAVAIAEADAPTDEELAELEHDEYQYSLPGPRVVLVSASETTDGDYVWMIQDEETEEVLTAGMGCASLDEAMAKATEFVQSMPKIDEAAVEPSGLGPKNEAIGNALRSLRDARNWLVVADNSIPEHVTGDDLRDEKLADFYRKIEELRDEISLYWDSLDRSE